MRHKRGGPFWTAYRKFYVAEHLDRGTPKTVIAERLGCTAKALQCAISYYRLRAPEALAHNG